MLWYLWHYSPIARDPLDEPRKEYLKDPETGETTLNPNERHYFKTRTEAVTYAFSGQDEWLPDAVGPRTRTI